MYSNSLICIAIVLVQILRDDILKQAEESRVSSVYLLYIQSKMFGDSAILFVQENAVRRSQFHFQSREYCIPSDAYYLIDSLTVMHVYQ